jgi:hypothetical protein
MSSIENIMEIGMPLLEETLDRMSRMKLTITSISILDNMAFSSSKPSKMDDCNSLISL